MNSSLPGGIDEIKEAQEKFQNHELRKVLYEVAEEKREAGKTEKAIKIILLGWNWRAYAGTNVTNSEMDAQISNFVQRAEPLTTHFRARNLALGSVDFDASVDGNTVGSLTKDIFKSIYEESRISSTGASKAMHMLYPDVFMMWDYAITKAYHKKGEPRHWNTNAGRGKHARGTAECYLNFLRETQDFVDKEIEIGQFPEESPAKVMDEYNYANFGLD